ncbi:MAG: helix-turn-helix domain-containing protein [Lachnospiraceae bacterium]|jgi:two-component system response regulator YesN|nr:helix-turn-helix domain-containing protein [Lachnospiraceae bacterium]
MEEKVRIYVVDDEPMAVAYFKSLVEEASPEYEIVGEAFWGVQALSDIKRLKPDIAFLDISMPVMNGLTLAEKVLNTHPMQKIVLLTSYQDFDFVKKGLELGVCAYVLKNELSTEALTDTIEKIRGDIRVEKQRMHSYTEENLREFLFSKSGETSGDLVYQKHPLQRFALIFLMEDLPISFVEEQESSHGFDAIRLEELKYGFGIFCRNAISVGAGRWCGIMFIDASVPDSIEALGKAAEEMLKELEGFGISASAILSDGTGKFLELPEIFQDMLRLSQGCFSYGKKQILKHCDLIRKRQEMAQEKRSAFSLMYSLSEEDPNASDYIVKVLLEEAAGSFSKMEYIRVAKNIAEVLHQFAEQKKLTISFDREQEPFDSTEDVEAHFQQTMKEIYEQLERQRQEQYSYPVLESLAFVQEHYNENISIQDIAGAAGVSEGHLRKCFRQELGVSVVEYLTSYRMERAKKLMESREYKISEIYRLVGFTSSQYFSYVFKKTEGITPSEYLKRV